MVDKIKIRSVQAKDVDLLYNWSNDELVRAQSFSSEEIPYESHCKWFEQKLKDTKAILLIIEVEGVSAGIVRFDEKEDQVIIGVSIDGQFRGKGLGSEFIKVGVAEFFKSSALTILASIKKENVASVKSFQKAGFSFLKEEEINGVESLIYKIEK